jgi:hypothetical protein
MDYQGQKLAEILFHLIILSFGSVGWVMGYFDQNFMIVFKVWLVGVVLSVLVRLVSLWCVLGTALLSFLPNNDSFLSSSCSPFHVEYYIDLRSGLAVLQSASCQMAGIRPGPTATARQNIVIKHSFCWATFRGGHGGGYFSKAATHFLLPLLDSTTTMH